MPIFEYRCKQCETQFEELVFSESDRPVCPSCGNASVEKQFSAFGVGASSDFCSEGACPMPQAPVCGQGACPSCM